jgi:hypothetical protein
MDTEEASRSGTDRRQPTGRRLAPRLWGLVTAAALALAWILSASGPAAIEASRASAPAAVEGPGVRGPAGTVRSTDGRPVRNAAVRVAFRAARAGCLDPMIGAMDNLTVVSETGASGPQEVKEAMARTDAQGKFRLAEEEGTEESILLVTADGFAPHLAPVKGSGPLRITLSRGAEFLLHVAGAHGEAQGPVEGWLVPLGSCRPIVESHRGALVFHAKADDDGMLLFRRVPFGPYGVYVRVRETMLSVRDALPVTEARLEFAVRLPGWVLEDIDERPVSRTVPDRMLEGRIEPAGAARSLIVEHLPGTDGDSDHPSPASSVEVRPNRSFVVAGVPPWARRLRIIAPGFGKAEIPLEDSSDDLGAVVLKQAPTIEGEVRRDDLLRPGGLVVQALSRGEVVCIAQATKEGRFACSGPRVRDEGIQFIGSDGTSIVALAPLQGSTTLVLVPSPGPRVEIAVKDAATGDPIRDVKIVVEPVAPGTARGSKRTLYGRSEGGIVSFHDAGSRRLQLTVGRAAGGPVQSAEISWPVGGGSRSVSLSLPPGVRLSGDAVMESTLQPVRDARVMLLVDEDLRAWLRLGPVARTDAEGKWWFAGLADGAYRLSAKARGTISESVKARVGEQSSGSPVRLVLAGIGAIRGSVTGLKEGARATVDLIPWPQRIDPERQEAKVDDAGRFDFDPVRAGKHHVMLSAYGGSTGEAGFFSTSLTVDVFSGETAYADFRVGGEIRLSGKAYLGGLPAAKANLSFRSLDRDRWVSTGVVTDEEGRYEVALPRSGDYVAGIRSQDPYSSIGGVLKVRIGDGGPQRQDLRFSAGEIRGRLVDEEGLPIKEAMIHARLLRRDDLATEILGPPGSVWLGQAYTEDDGTLRLLPLTEGDYMISFSDDSRGVLEIGPVSLSRDETEDLGDIVLRKGDPLELRAVGASGRPLADVTVGMFPDGDLVEVGYAPYGEGDKEGKVVIKGLKPGTYTLVGFCPGLAPIIMDGVAIPRSEDAPPLVLRFTAGGSIQALVLGQDGAPLSGAQAVLMDPTGRDLTRIYTSLALVSGYAMTADDEGRLRLPAVQPGRYSVAVRTGKNLSAAQEVTVRGGDSTTVTFVVD